MKLTKVHKDHRRKISVILGMMEGDKEFSIIELNKGKAIGGCYHSQEEGYLILKGEVLVLGVFLDKKLTYKKVKVPHHGIFLSNEAHGFLAKEDSIIVEYGITTEDKLDSGKDPFLTKYVNKHNEVQ